MFEQTELQRHLLEVHQTNEFFCIFCGLQSNDIEHLKIHMSERHPEKLSHIASRRTIGSVSDDKPTYVYIGQQESRQSFKLWKCKDHIGINTLNPSLLAHDANRKKLHESIETDELHTSGLTPVRHDKYIPESITFDEYKRKFALAKNIEKGNELKFDETWTTDTMDKAISRENDEHMNSNSFEKLMCKFCLKYIKSNYVEHLQTHRTKYYKCANCQHCRHRQKNDNPRNVAYEMIKHFKSVHKSEKCAFFGFDKANKKMVETQIEYKCDLKTNGEKCDIHIQSARDIDRHFSGMHPQSNRRASSVRIERHVLDNIVLNELAGEFQATGSLSCQTCNHSNIFSLNEYVVHGRGCNFGKIKYKTTMLNGFKNSEDASPESLQSGPVVAFHCLNCVPQTIFSSPPELFEHHKNDHKNEKLKYTLGKMVLCQQCECLISTHDISTHYSEAHPSVLQPLALTLGCRNRCGFCTEHISEKHCVSAEGHWKNNKIILPIKNLIPRYASGKAKIEAYSCNCCKHISFKTISEMVDHVQCHRKFYCFHCDQQLNEFKAIVAHQVQHHQMSVVEICEKQQCIKTLRDLCQYVVHFSSGLVLSKELLYANVTNLADEINENLLLDIVSLFQREKNALEIQN